MRFTCWINFSFLNRGRGDIVIVGDEREQSAIHGSCDAREEQPERRADWVGSVYCNGSRGGSVAWFVEGFQCAGGDGTSRFAVSVGWRESGFGRGAGGEPNEPGGDCGADEPSGGVAEGEGIGVAGVEDIGG